MFERPAKKLRVGFPNAGKSSLIAAMSAARPKIADYPFTTLVPNLGVVEAGEVQFVVADVPGLIPGASAGKGLGLDFLRHVERCKVLVHVLDCATEEPGRDPVSDLDALEAELAAYEAETGARLVSRPRLVVLNKVDVPERGTWPRWSCPSSRPGGCRSTWSRRRPRRACASWSSPWPRSSRPSGPPPRRPSRPAWCCGPSRWPAPDFELVRAGENSYIVRGRKPLRWIHQTDFSNDEAVGFLADRLAKLGIEEALTEAGAEAGAEVIIGPEDNAVVFDWDPSVTFGGFGPRGSDNRVG